MGLALAGSVLVPGAASAETFKLFAGSYTAGASKGIYAWDFDSTSGALAPLGLVAEAQQPAHIWIRPDGKTLYAVNWLRPEGAVSAFRIDRRTGQLTLINQVPSRGGAPNQVMVDPSGRIAVTVNYATGTLAAYRIEADGRLSDTFYQEAYTGAPIAPRQTGAHTHGIQFSHDGRIMWIAELGLDRIYSYHVDAAAAKITPAEPAYIHTHAGAGPRRIQLSPNGRFLYVNHETDSEVSVFAVDGARLREIQTVTTLPAGFAGANTTAEIVIDNAGRRLYVGNRGHDSIAVFEADPTTGRLTLQSNVAAGGKTPRNLRIDPTGAYLLSANEGGGSIAVLKIDAKTGGLTPTGSAGAIDTPGGLYFLP